MSWDLTEEEQVALTETVLTVLKPWMGEIALPAW